MNFRLTFTLIISKLYIKACRLLKLGGTSLPGKVATRLYPDIIKVLTKGFNIIMITGTNGKTTTTKAIAQILSESGVDFITNKSGANLVNGIVGTFIEAADLKGRFNVKTALIEVDEAAFDRITEHIQPNLLVVTNFFRDQLDRYGELYTTLNRVKSGITKSPAAKLVLNSDDSLCATLGAEGRDVVYYGLSSDAYECTEEIFNSDATFCIFCKSKYEYKNRVYGHLGSFKCPNCGYERPASTITCTKVDELTSSYSKIRFVIEDTAGTDDSADKVEYTAKINLPGLYNVYNALAAASCAYALGLPVENTVKALESVESGFGRMETIKIEDKSIKVILVKNPTGFNQVLNYLLTEENNIQIAFAINDKYADGTDVSWLWDVEFEKLDMIQNRVTRFYTTGIRAEDMAVRLKYAGIYTNKIEINKDYKELIETGLSATEKGSSFYILPTYTAMLDIRSILKKKFGLKEFWK